MFYSERQEELLRLLRKEKSMTVHRLARLLFTSEATVRRDLSTLEAEGKVRRTFGGAVLMESDWREVPLLFRKTQNVGAKNAIAVKAASFLADGQVIFLDSSSTAAHMVPHLEKYHDLTVITNSPQTSIALGEHGINGYCTGGQLLKHSFSYVGGSAADFIEGFRADLVFFSCRGYTPADGNVSESSAEEAYIKKKMIAGAAKKIFLCDESKFEKAFPYRICTHAEVDAVVTENKICSPMEKINKKG